MYRIKLFVDKQFGKATNIISDTPTSNSTVNAVCCIMTFVSNYDVCHLKGLSQYLKFFIRIKLSVDIKLEHCRPGKQAGVLKAVKILPSHS